MAAVVSLLLALCPGHAAQAQTPTSSNPGRELTMTTHASGTFDVKLTPQNADAGAAGAAIGRMTIDKQFHGDLEGTSSGVMLAARTAIPNSAGYVALELVRGTVGARTGTFMLQHSGTMNRGTASLVLTVVPDSGTDGLMGISGSMTIIIEGKQHSYTFDYAITGMS